MMESLVAVLTISCTNFRFPVLMSNKPKLNQVGHSRICAVGGLELQDKQRA
jgi:hypothetical protein